MRRVVPALNVAVPIIRAPAAPFKGRTATLPVRRRTRGAPAVTENEQYFHDVMKREGQNGRLDRSIVAPGVMSVFSHRERAARKVFCEAEKLFPTMPPVHFDFVDTIHVGAWAFCHDQREQYFVGYSFGTELTLLLLFNRILADSRLLRDIGNPESESDSLAMLAQIIGASPTIDASLKVFPQCPEPKDSTRRQFAGLMRELVATFIVLHEAGHLSQGHIEYGRDHYRWALLADPGYPSTREEELLVRQTFEVYADHQAISNGMHNIQSAIKNADRQNELLKPFVAPPHRLLHLWLFAIFTFCRLFGDRVPTKAELQKLVHPHWRFRQKMMMRAIGGYLATTEEAAIFGTVGEVQELIHAVVEEVEIAVHLITGDEMSVEGLLKTNEEEISNHEDLLIGMWENGGLREALRDYSHIPGVRRGTVASV